MYMKEKMLRVSAPNEKEIPIYLGNHENDQTTS